MVSPLLYRGSYGTWGFSWYRGDSLTKIGRDGFISLNNTMPEILVLERGDAVSPSSRLSSFAVYTPSYARADGSVSITHATEPLARVSEFHF